jgi:hypothetical protein
MSKKTDINKPMTESQIQKGFVRWFRGRYTEIEPLFFAVSNGGIRNAWTAKIMKDEGVRAGVSDLILLIPKHGYAGLLIETKKPDGKQSESQKEFEQLATKFKYLYVIVRNQEDFERLMMWYIENKGEKPILI